MPVTRCTREGKPGYKWGDEGHCYTYTPGDRAGRNRAKQQAIRQGLAIGGGQLKEDSMALKVDNSKGAVSGTSWGNVSKTALGNRLADAYAAGDASKSVINEVYVYVPSDAFGTDSEGKKEFSHSKAWGPHHEIKGTSVVINRDGVGAAAGALSGARSKPSLSAAQIARGRAHLRRHYRHMGETPPDSLKERLRVDRGQPLQEVVKGSFEYALGAIRQAFYARFGTEDSLYPYLVETFADHVIVKGEGQANDEFYLVTYGKDEAGAWAFADQEDWEPVELTYQPVATRVVSEGLAGNPAAGPVGEEQKFVDVIFGGVRLEEAREDDPHRYINGIGYTADVVNGNGRLYPAAVLREAIKEARTHLDESMGQGRLAIVGEAEHPSDKGQRPQFLETIVKWVQIEFSESRGQVMIRGRMADTSKGRDAIGVMEAGVLPAISGRAYGRARVVKMDDGQSYEEVTDLRITGFDLLSPGEGSDPNAGVLTLEGNRKLYTEAKVDFNEFLQALKDEGLFEQLAGAVLTQFEEAQREKNKTERERMLREALGAQEDEDLLVAARRLVAAQQEAADQDALEQQLRADLELSDTDDLNEALRARFDRLVALEQQETRRQVEAYVEEQVKAIHYPDFLEKQLVSAVKAAAPASVEAAKELIVERRKEYDALWAEIQLRQKGFGVSILGPTLDGDHVPAYARPAQEITEALIRRGLFHRHHLEAPQTVNEKFAAQYLEKFDKRWMHELRREARLMEEAEQTSDLSLPYSITRAIIAEAVPQLVATGIFDVGVTDQSSTRVYYESHAGETGYHVTVTDEDVTSDEGAWVALANQHVTPGTVNVEPDGGGSAYTEGTDYVVDYLNGRFFTLAAGTIGDSTALDVDYEYDALRKGELATIERAKSTLSYTTLEMEADRLATQISTEAILFSRSQIGWDARARTLAMLTAEIARKIDRGLLYLALAAALQVASNSGGTWASGSDELSALVEYVGVARVLVGNRYYQPTAILMSLTNSDRVANWDSFAAAGLRPDSDLRANGFVGRLKGLPVFETTEFPDGYIVVCDREVVFYRVYQAMVLKGPYPSYDASTAELIAAEQYYAEQFSGADAPVPEKAAYVKIA